MMDSATCINDQSSNVSWQIVKYTKLAGTRLEISVSPGQFMNLTYNKSRCFLSVVYNSFTLEEFPLSGNPRPTIRTKEKDIFVHLVSSSGATLTRFRLKFANHSDHASFVELVSFFFQVQRLSSINSTSDFSQSLSVRTFAIQLPIPFLSSCISHPSEPTSDLHSTQTSFSQVFLPMNIKRDPALQERSAFSQPTAVEEKVYEVLKSVQYSAKRKFYEFSESDQVPFLQISNSQSLNSSAVSEIIDQKVPCTVHDFHRTASHESMHPSIMNFAKRPKEDVGVQTKPYLSIDDLMDDTTRLKEYLSRKLKDQQFLKFVEKCAKVFEEVAKGKFQFF
ncbi:unnamed protein product [Thelazia callipaeda]|uniref:MSP domain-containing protein n=1 Tax=Thelazia callipaeda TaxID=103827 RepID=A0A0N5D4C3_THECL|nr:unnamed protein product [Thelazia callipaeda]